MHKSYDKHLNIFWSYNGSPYLEDNLTRAFIITLSFLRKEEQVNIIEELIGEKLKLAEDFTIRFDLQNPYIKNIRESSCKKYLVGFNPSGKTWGSQFHKVLEKFQDYTFDEETLKREGYEKYLLNIFPNLKEELEKEDENKISNYSKLKEIILARLNRGESRIDGWVFIHEGNELKVAIGIETKLWDLDPYQLSNHCEKSLGINESEIKYKKFKEVFDFLKKIYMENNNYDIIYHFLDYMEKTGHYINNETFTEDDFLYAWENNDYRILREKFDKYIENYTKSFYYEELRKHFQEYELEFSLDSKKVYFNNIGKNGIGNIYFDSCFLRENDKCLAFFVGTEVGVANKWWNEKFNEKLESQNFIETLKYLYKNEGKYVTKFETFARINQASFSDYIFLKESKNLEEILSIKKGIPYCGKLVKDDCIAILKSMNIWNGHMEKKIEQLKKRGVNSSASNYNLLSYCRFIDYVENDYIYGISEEDFNEKFHNLLISHLEGLLKIYKELKEVK